MNPDQNAKLISLMTKEVVGSSVLEAFLESAPQVILQSYIILKTGNFSKNLFIGLKNSRLNVTKLDLHQPLSSKK